MRRLLAPALLLAGCQRLLGLDDIHVVPPDGAPLLVTGRYVARVASNDVKHLPIVNDVPFPSITARARLADGTTPDVTWSSDGSFSFPSTTGMTYALQLAGNGITTEYQLAAETLDIAEPVLDRLDRVPPGPGTAIAWALATPTPSNSVVFATSTGQWSFSELGIGPASSYTLDWTGVRTTPAWGTLGAIGLLDASQGDRLFLGVFEPTATSIMTMTSYRSDDVTLVSGNTSPLAGTTMAVPSPTCVSVNVLRVGELDRLVTAGYGDASSFQGSWGIIAMPAPELGTAGETLLAYSTDGFTTDVSADVTVGNPFDGHALGMYLIVATVRPLFAPGATSGFQVANATSHAIRVTAACPTASTILGMVALPSQLALDGSALDVDNLSIALDRSRPATLGWTVADRNYESFRVELYELYTDAANQTQARVTARIRTLSPQAAIDPALLEANKTYAVAVLAELGYPGAGTGDFRTVAFPVAYSQLVSHTFTIAN